MLLFGKVNFLLIYKIQIIFFNRYFRRILHYIPTNNVKGLKRFDNTVIYTYFVSFDTHTII